MIVSEVKTRVTGQVAPTTLGLTLVVSLGGLSFSLLQGWPLWAVGAATVLAWLPMFAMDVARVMRAYQWLALFYVLVVTQAGHFLEHVAQMIQIHVLSLTGPDARGIFGTFDIEWVTSSGIPGYSWRGGAAVPLSSQQVAVAHSHLQQLPCHRARLHLLGIREHRNLWHTRAAGPGRGAIRRATADSPRSALLL